MIGVILWALLAVVVVANLWLRSQKKRDALRGEKQLAQRRAFRTRRRL